MTTQTLVYVLFPDEQFEVAEYQYTRFMFGTDTAYAARYGQTVKEPGHPWAFPMAAAITSTPQTKPVISAHLAFGSLVTTPGYGTYRLERDHNRNVKFVQVSPEPSAAGLADCDRTPAGRALKVTA